MIGLGAIVPSKLSIHLSCCLDLPQYTTSTPGFTQEYETASSATQKVHRRPVVGLGLRHNSHAPIFRLDVFTFTYHHHPELSHHTGVAAEDEGVFLEISISLEVAHSVAGLWRVAAISAAAVRRIREYGCPRRAHSANMEIHPVSVAKSWYSVLGVEVKRCPWVLSLSTSYFALHPNVREACT